MTVFMANAVSLRIINQFCGTWSCGSRFEQAAYAPFLMLIFTHNNGTNHSRVCSERRQRRPIKFFFLTLWTEFWCAMLHVPFGARWLFRAHQPHTYLIGLSDDLLCAIWLFLSFLFLARRCTGIVELQRYSEWPAAIFAACEWNCCTKKCLCG